MKGFTGLRRLVRRVGRDDSGMALMTVVTVSMIIFIMLITTLVMVDYRTKQTTHYTNRNKSMQLADSGINEYLFRLKDQGYAFYASNPTLDPPTSTVGTDGTWHVVATAPTNSDLLKLVSTGTLSNGNRNTVTATVKFPNYADYCVFVIDNYSVGPGFVFDGDVYCQGWLDMDLNANITGLAKSTSGFKKGGSTLPLTNNAYPAGTRPYSGGARKISTALTMSNVTNDLASMSASATVGGIKLPAYTTAKYGSIPSGSTGVSYTTRQGYELTFNQASVTVRAVQAERQQTGR